VVRHPHLQARDQNGTNLTLEFNPRLWLALVPLVGVLGGVIKGWYDLQAGLTRLEQESRDHLRLHDELNARVDNMLAGREAALGQVAQRIDMLNNEVRDHTNRQGHAPAMVMIDRLQSDIEDLRQRLDRINGRR
jgi:site-specific recombinase